MTRARLYAAAVLVVEVLALRFAVDVTWGVLIGGIIGGLVSALMAAGISLVWRANRVINLAQGDLGVLPATLGVLLVVLSGLSYWLGFAIGLVAALAVGALVEVLIIRRFAHASRVVLTVATMGVSQLLAFATLLLPRMWGEIPTIRNLAPPFRWEVTIGGVIFNANDLLATVVSVVLLGALGVLLARTRIGMLVRAAADNRTRAVTLGVPINRLQTFVWATASLLGFVSIWLSSGTGGLSYGFGLSLNALLLALAAVVIGRMGDMTVIVAASVALGTLGAAVKAATGNEHLPSVVSAVAVVLALLAMRASRLRADRDESSTWRASNDQRAIPAELRGLPEVRAVRGLVALLIGTALLVAPLWFSTRPVLKFGEIMIFATVGVSLVVLSGWAGQISLGQIAFVGIGAALAAWCQARWQLDPFLVLILASVAGAVAAVIVGLPALRVRGLFLAVSTLAMAVALSDGLFSNPDAPIVKDSFAGSRPAILRHIALDSPLRIYYLAFALFVVCVIAARGIRRSRTGRVLLALRDNEAGVEAYGISTVRAKLTAFAVSGAMAAAAGAVMTYHQAAFKPTIYGPGEGLSVFSAAVVGGIGSLPGALIGAVVNRGATSLPGYWSLLALSIGALFVLLALPQGIGGALTDLRDVGLRGVARRRGIVVPSLTELGGLEEAPLGAGDGAGPPTPTVDPEVAVAAAEERIADEVAR